MGFILIIGILLVFLNAKAGFWVAMGIPFCMSFTLIVANIWGYTVNNMTLAGIIIVLGIVVDDAIIIAENIARKREEGMDYSMAPIEGTHEVVRLYLCLNHYDLCGLCSPHLFWWLFWKASFLYSNDCDLNVGWIINRVILRASWTYGWIYSSA